MAQGQRPRARLLGAKRSGNARAASNGSRASERKPGPAAGEHSPGGSEAAPLLLSPAQAVEILRISTAPAGLHASAATTLSGVVGNRTVSRLLSAASRQHISRQDDAGSSAEERAEEIYDALNWVDDVPRAQRALRRANPQWEAVQAAFREEHGSIWEYLTDQLSTDEVIDAYANFMHGSTHGPIVGLARAILPTGTRDTEIHRILGSVDAGRRQELADRYAHDYEDLGEGTLRADLIDDQSGWELEKSLSLLDHDTTEAEKLYFDSLAITGTNTAEVVARLQRLAGDSDPNKFAKMDQEWDSYVSGTSGWNTAPPEVFTSDGLRAAMESELSGEEAGFALAAIDQGRLRSENADGAVPPGMEGAPANASAMTEDQIFEDERIRLQMHETYINSAAEGAGTNEQQIFDAIEAIRTIWNLRIRRAAAGQAEAYRAEWQATQDRLRPIVNDEMDESGVENLRVRLLLAGALTPADELYLAKEDRDEAAAVAAVTKAWASGSIDTLQSQANEDRVDAEGRTLRPHFDPLFAVPVTSALPFSRIAVLLNRDYDDPRRGAERLKIELDEGTADSDCERARQFLNSTGLAGGRRNAVISAFVELKGIGDRDGETPTDKFLDWLAEKYENSNATWAMLDLLSPTTDPAEFLARARGRHDAAHSGVMDAVLNDFARDWGHITGEDTVEVEQESLARLEFIVDSGTTPEELQAMMEFTGKSSVEELAGLQYQEYLARLEDLRALKATVAEGLATAVELLAAAALTVATAGAAGGALVAAVGSALAGMVAREALLGSDYELLSEENAKQLLITAVTAGVGEYVGPALRDLEAIERLGTAAAFARGALSQGAQSLSSETLSTMMADRMPTAETLTASALRVLGSALGSGVSGHMTDGLGALPIEDRILPTIRANIASNMISGVTAEASALTSGTGSLTAGDIGERLLVRIARGVGEGTIGGLAEVGAADVAASRAGGQPETGEGDTDEVDGEAVTTAIGDPEKAGADALATAHSTELDEAGAGDGGSGNRVPPAGGGGGGGDDDDRLFPGLTDDEFDFGALGPLDSAEAPGRSDHATVVGELDRNNPLSSAGNPGSTAAQPGYGAFAHRVQTERGDTVDAVIKILPADKADVFGREVAGARAAAVTGIGPPFYGVVEMDGDLAFAMGPVAGDFPSNDSLDAPGTPGFIAAEAQAAAAVAALTDQAPADVRNYAAALHHLGYKVGGDLQGLIGPDGRWRPIDFQGVTPLPEDASARADAIAKSRRDAEREATRLERTLAERNASDAGGSP